MNNTRIINHFNSDNRNIAYIKIQDFQMMTTVACRILKFESMTKKSIVENHVFFTFITFSRVNSFAYINSFVTYYL